MIARHYIWRSTEGYGTPPGIEDYPFQGLDLPWATDPPIELSKAKQGCAPVAVSRPGEQRPHKYEGHWTPLGASVQTLWREGQDMLSADCGYCSRNLAKCACGSTGGNPE